MVNKCYLRKVEPDDIDLLFQWTNDAETRRNSFDSHTISLSEHREWFGKMIKDPDRIQYIMMNGGTPVGQIRVDITGEDAEISYSIAPTERSKGFGGQIIKLLTEQIKEDCPQIKTVRGLVKPQNKASIACFEENGFCEMYRTYEMDLAGLE